MDNTYRFRFLIYLAAFVLIMSLCFAYAEPLPASSLSYRGGPQHSGFAPDAAPGPVFNPADLQVAVAPDIPNVVVLRLDVAPRRHFAFFHRHSRQNQYIRPVPAGLDGMVVLPSGIAISTP